MKLDSHQVGCGQFFVGDSDPRRIGSCIQFGSDIQASVSGRVRDHFADRLVTHKWASAPVLGRVPAHPVLDPVPFTNAGWGVALINRELQLDCQRVGVGRDQPSRLMALSHRMQLADARRRRLDRVSDSRNPKRIRVRHMDIKKDFEFTSVSGRIPDHRTVGSLAASARAVAPSPLGALEALVGIWKGRGFNQIWRPNQPADRFLELNETIETLEFAEIPGDIPNRGLGVLGQPDINLHGLTYLQQVQDANVLGPNGNPAGIHIEPGIWINIPTTTNPSDTATVSRMANIPHGTAFVAQGTVLPTISQAPSFPVVSITPFGIGQPGNLVQFPAETDLSNPSTLRTPPTDIPNVTQDMVDNPNVFLSHATNLNLITSTATLNISTLPLNPPSSGGGTSNIAFLQGAAGGPNAQAAQMDATFWIETFEESGQIKFQLQYSQRVLLNFNGLSWPHVSVATLIKQ